MAPPHIGHFDTDTIAPGRSSFKRALLALKPERQRNARMRKHIHGYTPKHARALIWALVVVGLQP